MNPEVLPQRDESAEARIRQYLISSKEAHTFDVANLSLSEDQLLTIVHLIDLSEKARASLHEGTWSKEDHVLYEEVRGKLDVILSAPVTSDTSDEGMLAAFLKNKLMVIDLIDAKYHK